MTSDLPETTEDILAKVAPIESAPEQPMYYFSAAIKVLFVREEKARERIVNVNAVLPNPFITQSVMHNIGAAACNRVMKENNVPMDDLRGTITMNISLLGHMLPSIFNDMPEDDQSEQAG